MSLVADYSSEDNISDDDGLSHDGKINHSSSGQNSNLLISQDGDNTSSDSESEDSSNTVGSNVNKTKLPNPLCQEKLAVPGKNLEMTSIGMTLFTNRYEQAELAKSSILEKHVQMTEKHPERGTRQVCFKFKKGTCHMGNKCRFFHDQSNIVNHALKKTDEEKFSDQLGHHSLNPGHSVGIFTHEPVDDDNYLAGKKRKKKVGVSNTLVPPKQALLRLEQQRQSERPWTIKK
ncbi:uncharacterized protein LOC121390539 [Gigantopelta aegis]|uniref:uncharacterized protein LOC121390539 n=1 Tax=Gigantopelta aegis TaxID=1735272 RepID=UPI001B888BA0|nr:uncharacterized protein LOC121390539 [Gigantopelta aegis]